MNVVVRVGVDQGAIQWTSKVVVNGWHLQSAAVKVGNRSVSGPVSDNLEAQDPVGLGAFVRIVTFWYKDDFACLAAASWTPSVKGSIVVAVKCGLSMACVCMSAK